MLVVLITLSFLHEHVAIGCTNVNYIRTFSDKNVLSLVENSKKNLESDVLLDNVESESACIVHWVWTLETIIIIGG